jgi:hypothetical protein
MLPKHKALGWLVTLLEWNLLDTAFGWKAVWDDVPVWKAVWDDVPVWKTVWNDVPVWKAVLDKVPVWKAVRGKIRIPTSSRSIMYPG